jgi:hypothetical protein
MKPPVAKYELNLKIRGNTLEEIETEIHMQANGGFDLDSDHLTRDNFEVYSGRTTSKLTHANPDMTPERYAEELKDWSGRV